MDLDSQEILDVLNIDSLKAKDVKIDFATKKVYVTAIKDNIDYLKDYMSNQGFEYVGETIKLQYDHNCCDCKESFDYDAPLADPVKCYVFSSSSSSSSFQPSYCTPTIKVEMLAANQEGSCSFSPLNLDAENDCGCDETGNCSWKSEIAPTWYAVSNPEASDYVILNYKHGEQGNLKSSIYIKELDVTIGETGSEIVSGNSGVYAQRIFNPDLLTYPSNQLDSLIHSSWDYYGFTTGGSQYVNTLNDLTTVYYKGASGAGFFNEYTNGAVRDVLALRETANIDAYKVFISDESYEDYDLDVIQSPEHTSATVAGNHGTWSAVIATWEDSNTIIDPLSGLPYKEIHTLSVVRSRNTTHFGGTYGLVYDFKKPTQQILLANTPSGESNGVWFSSASGSRTYSRLKVNKVGNTITVTIRRMVINNITNTIALFENPTFTDTITINLSSGNFTFNAVTTAASVLTNFANRKVKYGFGTYYLTTTAMGTKNLFLTFFARPQSSRVGHSYLLNFKNIKQDNPDLFGLTISSKVEWFDRYTHLPYNKIPYLYIEKIHNNNGTVTQTDNYSFDVSGGVTYYDNEKIVINNFADSYVQSMKKEKLIASYWTFRQLFSEYGNDFFDDSYCYLNEKNKSTNGCNRIRPFYGYSLENGVKLNNGFLLVDGGNFFFGTSNSASSQPIQAFTITFIPNKITGKQILFKLGRHGTTTTGGYGIYLDNNILYAGAIGNNNQKFYASYNGIEIGKKYQVSLIAKKGTRDAEIMLFVNGILVDRKIFDSTASIQIDDDTFGLVAILGNTQTSFLFADSDFVNTTISSLDFTVSSLSPSGTLTFTHNRNTLTPFISVQNTTSSNLIPSNETFYYPEINVIDANNVMLDFSGISGTSSYPTVSTWRVRATQVTPTYAFDGIIENFVHWSNPLTSMKFNDESAMIEFYKEYVKGNQIYSVYDDYIPLYNTYTKYVGGFRQLKVEDVRGDKNYVLRYLDEISYYSPKYHDANISAYAEVLLDECPCIFSDTPYKKFLDVNALINVKEDLNVMIDRWYYESNGENYQFASINNVTNTCYTKQLVLDPNGNYIEDQDLVADWLEELNEQVNYSAKHYEPECDYSSSSSSVRSISSFSSSSQSSFSSPSSPSSPSSRSESSSSSSSSSLSSSSSSSSSGSSPSSVSSNSSSSSSYDERCVPKIINGNENSLFGYSSTFTKDGSYCFIGSPKEEKVHIFRIHTPNPPTGVPGYTFVQTISSPLLNSGFGKSISCDEDANVLVIGMPNYLNNKGAFALYKKVSGSWLLVNTVTSPDGVGVSISDTFGDNFGYSIDINGNGTVIAIGAPGHTVNSNLYGIDAGAVYVYNFDLVSNITLDQKIYPQDGEQADYFGWDVSLSDDGNRVVSSSYDDDDSGIAGGSVYIFEKSTSWSQVNKILASDGATQDRFGWSVTQAKQADVIAIGSYKNSNVQGTFAGAVYVYRKVGLNWVEDKIVALDLVSNSSYGFDVSLDACGLTLAVSQLNYNVDYEPTFGSSYVYEYDGLNWNLLNKFEDNYQNDDSYGFTSVLSKNGNYLAVGAPKYNNDNGMVHIYQLNCFGRTVICEPDNSSSGP